MDATRVKDKRSPSVIQTEEAPHRPLLFDPLLDILDHIESFALDISRQGCLTGIKGDWGTGKTSTLRAIEDYFGKGRGWPTVFFLRPGNTRMINSLSFPSCQSCRR